MNRSIVTRRVLPFAVVLAAAAAQACAAPTGSEPAPASDEEIAAHEEAPVDGPAAKLSGTAGHVAKGVSAFAPDGSPLVGTVASDVVAQLYVPSQQRTFDVLAYGFGVRATHSITSGTGGAGASKPTFEALSLVVRPGGAPLVENVILGSHFGEVVLNVRDAKSGWVELATFQTVFVSAVATSAGGGQAYDQYAIEFGAMTLRSGPSSVSVNRTENTSACAEPCPCQNVRLGPYAQAPDHVAVPKGATRIDGLAVSVSNQVSFGWGTGGAGAGKAKLEGIDLASKFDTGAMCAVYYAARGTFVPSVELAVAAPVDPKLGFKAGITWDACLAAVNAVSIASSPAGPYQTMSLAAGGLVRTDRTFDVLGKETSSSTYGWSFVGNKAIASCKAINLP